MPRAAKGSSKKTQKKDAVVKDSKQLNELEKVSDSLENDIPTLTNGSVDTIVKEIEVSATKRSSGRAKKDEKIVEVVEEEVPKKKPAAKGRGKKKANENEVIEKEIEPKIDIVQEGDVAVETNQPVTVTKSKGRGKKAATSTKTTAVKEAEIEIQIPPAEEIEKVEPTKDDKVAEKKSKTTGGRGKKKPELEPKEIEVIPEPVVEKAKKSSKKPKKSIETLAESSAQEEPPKKKGRATKKDKSEDKIEVSSKTEESLEVNTETEKKPIKRGRAVTKAASKTEETIDNAEEVLPKKRSRKAPSVEKEIIEEKPKQGRGKKKTEKVEEVTINQGKEAETEINGQDKLEQIEEIKEPQEKKAEKEPTKARGGRKRAAPSANKQKTAADDDNLDNVEDNEDEADGSKPSKSKKKTDTDTLNSTTTKYNKEDFDLAPLPEGQTAEEPRFNYKISSWNVAGLRAWLKKDGLKFLDYEQPDIFCMQETKCTTDQLPEEVVRIPGYHPYWLCMPGGHAGVAIYSKIMPINVEYGIGNKEFDDCGRIITAEYEKFFLINVYVPNSGRKLVNLEQRMKWEKLFQEFIQNLNARKPVVICGDMNVSHQEHDLANPKANTRNAGFTKEEREKMTELLSLGYIDTFRHLYPERKGAYTFWTYMGNSRSRNVGWRLDYFIVSERFIKRVVDNCIRTQCMGSDHCPITLFLKL